MGHTDPCVDLERGVRRNGQRMVGAIHQHIDTIRTIAQHAGLSHACLERSAPAERGVPTMQATIAFVSGSVRQLVKPLELAPPQSVAMHARLIPSYSLDRVAATRAVQEAAPRRELAEPLRPPLFEADGLCSVWHPAQHARLQQEADKRADVCQRSSANVEGRNGSRSPRKHQLRGLDHPRKRVCLTAIPTFFLTRPDGTTAAERFFGQNARSMWAAMLASVDLPPAPLRSPRRAMG